MKPILMGLALAPEAAGLAAALAEAARDAAGLAAPEDAAGALLAGAGALDGAPAPPQAARARVVASISPGNR